ncbi:leucyl/phenylalanyl-tRNA--protein transferase [Legionella oakridgensis ATCC 33761 = DSM 21215]|uniref:Leucyl/phenylalanyl-tRNA--protein transferase n=2 Tax=Legionella oakridgensis TaxID=29423 RepID=W0BCU8_9GAMM|nr:leucyl/phenylalanyl-tRNA--protein transferase [Legionella oakridgensis ATCC 33761 = DSM 21215]ETO92736.1 leucyl/phenylalanyl-tRNA--protein transferase [Legionella oakridgensis RV-2-2007]KTD36971.1 leucyl/phenylalanyl-tRNA-protein transferase [Legionella oakridgensis]STY20720.1 leucyl/phenylalanyl-tRNA-protein transferase [Legionella longbeachae]
MSAERLLTAYRQGIFPWFNPGYPILWWSPDPRLILKPTSFKPSRSLKQSLKKPFHFTIDTAFSTVIHACATSYGRLNNTWITTDMTEAYTRLYTMGYAHSFEVWLEDSLAGGLYGISLGHVFFGESMFHEVRDASKLALYYLCQTLSSWGFDFIDCQLPTAHLQRLGAEIISRHQFLKLLKNSLQYPTRQGQWTNQTS